MRRLACFKLQTCVVQAATHYDSHAASVVVTQAIPGILYLVIYFEVTRQQDTLGLISEPIFSKTIGEAHTTKIRNTSSKYFHKRIITRRCTFPYSLLSRKQSGNSSERVCCLASRVSYMYTWYYIYHIMRYQVHSVFVYPLHINYESDVIRRTLSLFLYIPLYIKNMYVHTTCGITRNVSKCNVLKNNIFSTTGFGGEL